MLAKAAEIEEIRTTVHQKEEESRMLQEEVEEAKVINRHKDNNSR